MRGSYPGYQGHINSKAEIGDRSGEAEVRLPEKKDASLLGILFTRSKVCGSCTQGTRESDLSTSVIYAFTALFSCDTNNPLQWSLHFILSHVFY